MKQWFKEYGVTITFFYILFSFMILLFRITTFDKPIDCEVRYVDIVFPLSRLHCPIGFGWLK